MDLAIRSILGRIHNNIPIKMWTDTTYGWIYDTNPGKDGLILKDE